MMLLSTHPHAHSAHTRAALLLTTGSRWCFTFKQQGRGSIQAAYTSRPPAATSPPMTGLAIYLELDAGLELGSHILLSAILLRPGAAILG